jgi:uncharacterized membrane protein YkvA (DUF1232 family)
MGAHDQAGSAHALHTGARSPDALVREGAGARAYALSPIDLIPDFIPILGFLDEVILLPLAIAGVLKLVPAVVMSESRAAAAAAAQVPVSRTASAAIVLIWVAAIGLTGWLAYCYFGPP